MAFAMSRHAIASQIPTVRLMCVNQSCDARHVVLPRATRSGHVCGCAKVGRSLGWTWRGGLKETPC